jgi:hypothetical protein
MYPGLLCSISFILCLLITCWYMMCGKYSLSNSKCMQSVRNEGRDFFNYCLIAVNILLCKMEFVLIMECE